MGYFHVQCWFTGGYLVVFLRAVKNMLFFSPFQARSDPISNRPTRWWTWPALHRPENGWFQWWCLTDILVMFISFLVNIGEDTVILGMINHQRCGLWCTPWWRDLIQTTSNKNAKKKTHYIKKTATMKNKNWFQPVSTKRHPVPTNAAWHSPNRSPPAGSKCYPYQRPLNLGKNEVFENHLLFHIWGWIIQLANQGFVHAFWVFISSFSYLNRPFVEPLVFIAGISCAKMMQIMPLIAIRTNSQ